MANELPWASEWLRAALIGGLVASRVYEGIAPAGTAGPYIVFQVQSPGSDRHVLSGNRAGVDPLYLVRAIAQTGSWAALAPIADEIDTRLSNASGAAGGGRVIICRRESPFSQIDRDDPQYRHLGGTYRLHIGA